MGKPEVRNTSETVLGWCRRWSLKRHTGDNAHHGYFAIHAQNGMSCRVNHVPSEDVSREAFAAHIALGFPKGDWLNETIVAEAKDWFSEMFGYEKEEIELDV